MKDRRENGTRITNHFQNVHWAPGNALLRQLIRNGYPTGTSPPPTQDSGTRRDPTPHFFMKVFESSNDYVLVYQVNYPQTPTLTAMLNNPYVPRGKNNANNIT